MKFSIYCLFLALLLTPFTAVAQTPSSTLAVPSASTDVPRLIKFFGTAKDETGKLMTGPVGITFSLYQDQQGGNPLWVETQNVQADAVGHYTAMLGSATTEGMPLEVFSSGEAQWLGVQIQGQPAQARVLLVSVPYALKAHEAETLSGRSITDFVLVNKTPLASPNASNIPVAANGAIGSSLPPINNDGPTNFAGTNGTQIVNVTQKGAGAGLSATSTTLAAVRGTITGKSNTAVYGLASNTSKGSNAAGVTGQANTETGPGVAGYTSAPKGTGVLGIANATTGGTGVVGVSNATSGFTSGVYGRSASTSGSGLSGDASATSGNTAGVYGQSASTSGTGVSGSAAATSGFANGLYGQTASPGGNGVFGINSATSGGNGVNGTSAATTGTSNGVYGQSASTSGIGVSGNAMATSGLAYGVYGQSASTSGDGVSGNALATSGFANGVFGQTASPGGTGVFGINNATSGFAIGVQGQSASTAQYAVGVFGNQTAATGEVFGVEGHASSTGPNASAVQGFELATTGVVSGVSGGTNSSTNFAAGVVGFEGATTGQVYGVLGKSASTSGGGVIGSATATSGNTNGVYGESASPNGNGVLGINNATTGFSPGVMGVTNSPTSAGVYGYNATTTGHGSAVQGQIEDSSGGAAGVFITHAGVGLILNGLSGSSYAQKFTVDASGNGFYAGNLNVTGKLTKGSGSFKIDHPLDPANKYLSHSFVESPDMMNVYNGNITTDRHGVATVTLPDYFEALNCDFRYQLTVIGQFAQAIVKREIEHNRFIISTNKPSVKVSWQVTGIRHDAYADAYRVPTEEDKPTAEQGYYLHPEVFGQPASKSIQAASQKTSAPDQLAKVSNP